MGFFSSLKEKFTGKKVEQTTVLPTLQDINKENKELTKIETQTAELITSAPPPMPPEANENVVPSMGPEPDLTLPVITAKTPVAKASKVRKKKAVKKKTIKKVAPKRKAIKKSAPKKKKATPKRKVSKKPVKKKGKKKR